MKFDTLKNLIKEPIVQFAFLGMLLFAIDHALLINRDDPRNVLIDDRQIEQFIEIFEQGQGRPPSGREINNMVIAWAQNEILYREARRMGLDRGDDMIRNRLILKQRNVLFNNVVLDHPTENQLQQFFEFNHAAYHTPARYDLEMVVLPGHYDLTDARALMETAKVKGLPETHPGNRYRYQNRIEDNVIAMFGKQGSEAILSSEPGGGSWSLISNEQGHHLVRITARHGAVVPSLASVRSRVIQDWERYSGDAQIADQTYNLARHYQVRLDVSDVYREKMERNLPRNPFQQAPAVTDDRQGASPVRSGLQADRP